MASLTEDPGVISEYWVDICRLNIVDLELAEVEYGDRRSFTKNPTLCIEPATAQHEYQGAPLQVWNTLSIAFLVYNTGLEGVEGIQKETDRLTRQLATFINLESTTPQYGGTLVNGLVVAGLVTSREYGYRVLSDRMMRCNRLVWTGNSKTRLVEVP